MRRNIIGSRVQAMKRNSVRCVLGAKNLGLGPCLWNSTRLENSDRRLGCPKPLVEDLVTLWSDYNSISIRHDDGLVEQVLDGRNYSPRRGPAGRA